jgi:hypothetical protein
MRETRTMFPAHGSAAGGGERIEQASALSEAGLFMHSCYPQPRNALTPVRST